MPTNILQDVLTKTVYTSSLVVIKIWVRMARRVNRAGQKRSSNKHCTEISAVILFFIVLIVIVTFYFWISYEPLNVELCNLNETLSIENAVLQTDGSYRDKTGLVYPVGYYFRVNNTLRGCTCSLKPCIRKCCQAEQAISMETNSCAETNESSPFEPLNMKTYKMINSKPAEINVSRNHFTKQYGDVCYHGKFLLLPDLFPSDVSYLMSDGTIFYLGSYHTTAQYCLDSFVGNSTVLTLICFPPEQDAPTKATFQLYSSGMFVSLPFLLLTFLVYAVLSELQNFHGKSLMCYVLCLFFAYLLLGIVQMGGEVINQSCCVIFGEYSGIVSDS